MNLLKTLIAQAIAYAQANPARISGLVAAIVVVVAGDLNIVLNNPSVENVLLPIVVGELGHFGHKRASGA